jgi:probable rRNA maturation factor
VKASIAVVVEDAGWKRQRGLTIRIERAAASALAHARRSGALTVLLTDDKSLKGLNRAFRGKNKPTNVLSFPAAPNPENYLGDVAIALGVARKEAGTQGKSLSDHATHLAVHGVLHLVGFDHVHEREARRMERLEAAILAEFGVADPYLPGPKPA